VALAALPEVGPARLRALLAGGAAVEVLSRLAGGRLEVDEALAAACGRRAPVLLTEWARAAAALDVVALWARHVEAGVGVAVRGGAGYPDALVDDPEPPAVLFSLGAPDVLAGPRVAIVGTRRCTRYGYEVARSLGARLAGAGVAVVSGLAAGIDGAAHRGALDAGGAPPIGVVATGLDVAYPPGNRTLWAEVAAAGTLLSEAPLGTRPARWRFPARNRIIAGLADVVVVVESAAAGGALHTVDEALRRDRPVLAVPGPVTSAASVGTNRLLREVAAPACDADDVLVALGLSPGATRTARDRRPPPDPVGAVVLDALGWTPASLGELVRRSGRPPGTVALALTLLETDGWVATSGGWYERRRQEGA
jgi:DNA processing protein